MFENALQQHQKCIESLAPLARAIEQAADLLAQTIASDHKILICGNGGSASDAQHFAAELIGRFESERSAWPALALTTDTSILTAIGNDYGFDDVFTRQVQGLGRSGDVLIGISTSGNSANIVNAVAAAKTAGMQSVGLLGRDGGPVGTAVDHPIVVNATRTANIQEAHMVILHFWAHCIETHMAP